MVFGVVGRVVGRCRGSGVGVHGEVAEDLAGGGVDDAHVEVGDEQDDAGSGVGAADGDVVELAVDAQGDGAADGDAVVTDPEVGVAVAVAGAGFGAGRVGDGGGAGVGQGAVRSLTVVDVDEAVEQRLELGDVAGWSGWARSQAFIVCWKRSTFPHVVGWFGREFFWMMPKRRSSVSRPLRPPLPPDSRVVNTIPLSVSVDAGAPCLLTAVTERGQHDGAGDPQVSGDRQGVA